MQSAQERVKPVPLSGGVADEQQSRIVTLENAMEQMQRTLQQMQRTLEQSIDAKCPGACETSASLRWGCR